MKGKPIQIHHIDDDHSNSTYENLAVLCFDCHTDTQIRGGFHRKLDSDQVILYRSDWQATVSRKRAQQRATEITEDNKSDLGSLIKRIEELKAQRNYEELIFIFNNLNERELRDKYIELRLQKKRPFEEELYFRSMQGRLDLLSNEELKKHFADYEASEDWQDLARDYFLIGDKINGTKYMCKHVVRAISQGNFFNAAFCVRALALNHPVDSLFEKALIENREKKDLFWELRSLEELGWTDELMSVIKENLETIDKEKESLPFDMFQEYIDKVRSEAQTAGRVVQI
ncbi:MAG: endonuclease [Edaphobacter sp.]|nr:endonuclease [Edaphobacter sp.]